MREREAGERTVHARATRVRGGERVGEAVRGRLAGRAAQTARAPGPQFGLLNRVCHLVRHQVQPVAAVRIEGAAPEEEG